MPVGQKDIIGIVISNWHWEIKDTIFEKLAANKKSAENYTFDNRSIYLREEGYIFRNIFGNVGFTEGIHYWEVIADARTEHELKIGVSSINTMRDCEEYKLQV